MYYVLICKNPVQLKEPCLYIKGSKVKGWLVSVNMKGNQDKFSTCLILGPQGLRLLSTSLDLGIGRLTCKVKVQGEKNKDGTPRGKAICTCL